MKKNLEDLWAEDARRSLRIYKIIAGIMGVWPFTCQQTFSKIRFTSLIIILMSLITMLAVDLLIRSDNINATLESVVFGLSGFLGIVKITLPRIYWRHIESILISTAHDWSTTTSPKFREIVNKSSLIGTASFVLLLGGSLLISGLFGLYKVTLNLRVTSRNLTGQHVLFGAGYWTSNLPLSMNMVYVVQSIQLGVTHLSVSGNDACYCHIISHLSGQFEILSMNFSEINESGDRKYLPINELVRRHNHLLRMCLHVEKVYNVVVMCHLMNNLCFTSSALMLILTTWNDKQMGQVIIFGSTTIFLYGQIFLYSLVGEVMKTRSETLRYSVYNCRWYKLPLPERRKILFILTKMQKPMDFTAGNFYRLNLENFKNIVKFTVTLFSFLRLSLNK